MLLKLLLNSETTSRLSAKNKVNGKLLEGGFERKLRFQLDNCKVNSEINNLSITVY